MFKPKSSSTINKGNQEVEMEILEPSTKTVEQLNLMSALESIEVIPDIERDVSEDRGSSGNDTENWNFLSGGSSIPNSSERTGTSRFFGGAGTQLLIIYYHEFEHAARYMKAYKDQLGSVYKTEIVSTKDIYQLIHGTDPQSEYQIHDHEVKRFIKNYCETLGNKPRWLLLMGDTELIPTHYTGQMNTRNPSVENCGDIFYGQLDDLSVNIPSIGIGRFPAKAAGEALDMVIKMANYNSLHNNGAQFGNAFYNTFIMINGALDQSTEITLATASSMVQSNYYSVKMIRAQSATINDLLSAVQGNSAVLCHRGSAGRDGWHEPNFTYSQVSMLNPDGDAKFYLPLILSINSESGLFDEDRYPVTTNGSSEESVRPWAEELIKLKNNGAIGIIGACRPTNEADNNTLMLGIFEALCPTTPGESPIKFLGDILNHAKRKVINSDASQADVLQQITIYNLIGDPSLSVATQASVV